MQSSCGICKNEYDKNKNKPIILSCGDIVCQVCINFYEEMGKKEEIECPTCCKIVYPQIL
jgi:hypothetical protein